jgi:hypothetical protein
MGHKADLSLRGGIVRGASAARTAQGIAAGTHPIVKVIEVE